ncbi:AAC_HP2_G0013160.mRNA.1.CDS.1 [Saccharomyces cerevisiae]|nr:AAC_HP2_G0013160.mRNA.1.CDS.1 [Saccharomyces cerevisiae]CAI6451711.1 AAC_HP2_G0013160.mRNA.1.CDS.1 [Saccharomyces cerevisiae]CAI6455450.1 AAC_HP1_G0014260.mRNA.1.CDS.1 [Saccharomyces cerevisiae]
MISVMADEKHKEYFKLYYFQYMIIGLCTILFLYSEISLVPRGQNIEFSLDDSSISKRYVPNELVGPLECLILSVGLSNMVVFWTCMFDKDLLKKNRVKRLRERPDGISNDFHFMHTSILCLMLIISINAALTGALKLIIGNLRPDFVDRCIPDLQKMSDSDSLVFGLDICKQTNKWILYEGLKSTPSGHSSFIVSTMGFTYLWQRVFTTRNTRSCIWCPLLALVVMVSRVIDHRHHWYDVVSGAVLAFLVIYCCWKWTFTNLAKRDILPSPVSV